MKLVRRSLLWLFLATLGCPIAWGVAVTLAYAVRNPPDSISIVLAGMLMSPVWGAVVSIVFAVPYAAVLIAWPWLALRVPTLESTHRGLAVASAALALPAALVVGLSSAEFAGTIRPVEFVFSFGCAFAAGWFGLLAPRLYVRALAPGKLMATRPPAAA